MGYFFRTFFMFDQMNPIKLTQNFDNEFQSNFRPDLTQKWGSFLVY